MSNGRFGIIEAVKNAWLFMVNNRGYLLRIGFLPLVFQTGTALALQALRPDASMIESFVWTFPANLAFSWFMFAEMRYLLLGERLDRLPQDAAFLASRRHFMQMSVILLLLFDTAVVGAASWIDWSIRSHMFGIDKAVTLSVMALLGLMIWGVRFSVLHILAGVGYPLRDFLKKVRGIEFSVRLMGMGLLCALPVYMALGFILEILLPDVKPGDLTFVQSAVFICLAAPISLIVPVLLNAAAAFALKEILGPERRR